MKCTKCKKSKATYHITQIENGKKIELHYCESCARKEDPGVAATSLPLSKIVGGGKKKSGVSGVKEKKCSCGWGLSDIKRKGRFGCAACYTTFDEATEIVTIGQAGATEHTGKKPADFKESDEDILKKKVANVERELKEAVVREDYESAAKLRDEIRKLKSETAG